MGIVWSGWHREIGESPRKVDKGLKFISFINKPNSDKWSGKARKRTVVLANSARCARRLVIVSTGKLASTIATPISIYLYNIGPYTSTYTKDDSVGEITRNAIEG
jgi:hypothetical protein